MHRIENTVQDSDERGNGPQRGKAPNLGSGLFTETSGSEVTKPFAKMVDSNFYIFTNLVSHIYKTHHI